MKIKDELTVELTENQRKEYQRGIDQLERDPCGLWTLYDAPFDRMLTGNRAWQGWLRFVKSPDCKAVQVLIKGAGAQLIALDADGNTVRAEILRTGASLSKDNRHEICGTLLNYPTRATPHDRGRTGRALSAFLI